MDSINLSKCNYTCLMQLFLSCMGQMIDALNKNNCVRQLVNICIVKLAKWLEGSNFQVGSPPILFHV
jgi:hypothetical protein